MKVLVTGGAGYIGSHVCRALAEAGHDPVVFDNLSTGDAARVRWGALEEGDLRDASRVSEVITTHRPDSVMHFAAAIQVGESVENPGHYWDNNVGGSLTLARAMVTAGLKTLVFSSTCAVYAVDDATLTEESPLAPVSPYATTKWATERMLAEMGVAHGLRTIAFRYFNVAGAHPDGDLGQTSEGATHLIPRLLQAISGGLPEMTIHGDDYPTPDGTCVRDYIHVCDLARAHVLGLERLADGGTSRVYNLGTGHGASVRDMIEAAGRVVGQTPRLVVGPRRPGDAVRLVSGSRRASDELGWQPERSDIETIVSDAWRWHVSAGH